MKAAPLEWECFGITDIGLSRVNNEDVWSTLPKEQFFILADGMGGHQAGEVASSMAMQSMCASVKSLKRKAGIEEVCHFLREAVTKANMTVYRASLDHPGYAGMGTTLTCFLLKNHHLVYAHVGDSRLYRYRNTLEQLTQDHSLRQASLSTEGSPPFLFMRNVITRAIGTQTTILPDIGVISLCPEDVYMLCSDGLSDYVDRESIACRLASALPLEEIGKNLVDAALKSGGNDNITLLLLRIIFTKN
jgi:protein phosphatase